MHDKLYLPFLVRLVFTSAYSSDPPASLRSVPIGMLYTQLNSRLQIAILFLFRRLLCPE